MVQLQTKTTVQLSKAFCEGFSSYIPFSSYEVLMFMMKRIAGVPGYQHQVPNTVKCELCFTEQEIEMFEREYEMRKGHEYRKYLTFHENLLVIRNSCSNEKCQKYGHESKMIESHFLYVFGKEVSPTLKVFELKESTDLHIDDQFQKLSLSNKIRVKLQMCMLKLLRTPIIGSLLNAFFNMRLYFMKKNLNRLKKLP